ncbi:MAG: cyclic nucleotide-binding domain-containing protein, partial [Flavobacteriaceae bacterium]|nr:cyclic nucleotide-binding domain-containing protein [Flavobacteriaceae bacterium]
LSAKTEHKQVRKGMDMGADDYLTKPYEEEELISAVESRLAKATLISQVQSEKSKGQQLEEDFKDLNELKNFFDDNGRISTHSKGETIYRKGQYATLVYLINKGVVKLHTMDDNGKELITSLLKEDDFLGLTAIAHDHPYTEYATAVEDVELAGISITELKSILFENRKITLDLMDELSDNLIEVKEQLLQMAFSSVKKKTAQTILQFSNVLNKRPDEPIRISRYDLSSVAGIATESLIRTLSDFKKQGLIQIEGRNIRILDIEGLKNVI